MSLLFLTNCENFFLQNLFRIAHIQCFNSDYRSCLLIWNNGPIKKLTANFWFFPFTVRSNFDSRYYCMFLQNKVTGIFKLKSNYWTGIKIEKSGVKGLKKKFLRHYHLSRLFFFWNVSHNGRTDIVLFCFWRADSTAN